MALAAPMSADVSGVFGALPVAAAEPALPPPPVPAPMPRPMPADPARVNPIGGARISSTTPQGETAGLEAPLAAQTERGEATVPMWAKDGIFAPTAHPNRQIRLHLPGELGLAPAAWTPEGGAIYASGDVDYTVSPITGGGVDLVITRKTLLSSSTIPFGVKLPAATHLRQVANAVVVETDAVPGRPAAVIGTFSIPAAHDRDGAPITVSPTLGPGFPPGQSNLTIELGQANVFAFPVTITLAYRASDVPTTGAPMPNWEGLPEGSPRITAATDSSVRCPAGVNDYRSPDGRIADFTAACATHQQCLAATPERTSVTACHNTLLAHLSVACTATFGQTGPDYDTCTRAAESVVTTAKTTMTTPVS
ncbi:hypothetical protein [Mycolicibacterium conceptionense]|nr:hypothetical protein [Mycolicibacterium conceptionense]